MVKMLQMEVVMCGMNHLRHHSESCKCLCGLLSDNLIAEHGNIVG
jgi:hypothetical protein